MGNGIEAFGPYNFIPFPDKVIERYSSVDELPAHDSINPELYTGEIKVKITAETPLFISDGDKDNPKFFRDPSGKICIPGSSLRGLVRENAQILSLGLVAPNNDIEDYRIYYRNMAKTKSEADKKQHDRYREIIPCEVNVGYLNCRSKKYYIVPAMGTMLRIPMNDKNLGRFPLIYSLRGKNAVVVDVIYKAQGESVIAIEDYRGKIPTGFIKGKLLIPGKTVSNMYSAYVFPPENSSAEVIPVSNDDITSYIADYESRQTTLRNKDFWKLPNDDKCKSWPVFYRIDENGNISFGRSRYLRITFKKSIAEGLPPVHLKLKKGKSQVLDYARSIFGFTTDDVSYKSRVSFENLICTDPEAKEGETVDVVLGGPKPSFYAGYLSNGNTYDDDSFFLRGYKQYWFKEPSLPSEIKQNVAGKMAPIAADTTFTGTIHYKNLAADELGLLLWSLLPLKGYHQALGKAKPYGFGRVNIKLLGMTRLNVKSAYSSPDLSGANESIVNDASALIKAFKDKAAELYGNRIDGTKTVQSFLYMHSVVMERKQVNFDYDYPLLNDKTNHRDFRSFSKPLPTVLEIKDRSGINP